LGAPRLCLLSVVNVVCNMALMSYRRLSPSAIRTSANYKIMQYSYFINSICPQIVQKLTPFGLQWKSRKFRDGEAILPRGRQWVPRGCHRAATEEPRWHQWVQQGCYKGSSVCHGGATGVPRGCHGGATGVPRGCHGGATEVPRRCQWVSWGCHEGAAEARPVTWSVFLSLILCLVDFP
jgi:hypothetical protein